MLWENLREEEFNSAIESSKGVCILPVGCLEKHGQHLPVGTDVIHITEIARLAAEKEPAVVFPSMYFGEKTGAGEFKGTVIFSPQLRLRILSRCVNIRTRFLSDFFTPASLKYSQIRRYSLRFCLPVPEKIQTINLKDHKAFKSVFFQGGRLQEYFHISKPTTMKKPDFKAFGGVWILTYLLNRNLQ